MMIHGIIDRVLDLVKCAIRMSPAMCPEYFPKDTKERREKAWEGY